MPEQQKIGDVLEALAVRCERAVGPDRELDRAIGDQLFPPKPLEANESEPPAGFGRGFLNTAYWGAAYTASLDAAMQLVPGGEDGRWNTGRFNVDPNKCSAQVAVQGEIFIDRGSLGLGIKVRASATAATPALALCAAALRARSAQSGDILREGQRS